MLSPPNVIAMAIMIEMWTKSTIAYRRTVLSAIANPESRGARQDKEVVGPSHNVIQLNSTHGCAFRI